LKTYFRWMHWHQIHYLALQTYISGMHHYCHMWWTIWTGNLFCRGTAAVFRWCFRPAQHSILSPVALCLVLSAARWKLGWTRDWVGLGRAGSTFPRSYKMCIVGVSCPSANRSAFQTDSEGCSNNWELLAKKVTVKSSKSLGGGIHSGHASAVEETIWVANIRTLWT